MDAAVQPFLPRFRYGMIQPRSHEGRQRGAGYQFYRLVPLDVMEFSSVLGIENYTLAAVEKALGNYWNCVNALASEKVDLIIIGGAPVSAALGRTRMLDLIKETKEKTGIAVDAPLEAMIAAMNISEQRVLRSAAAGRIKSMMLCHNISRTPASK
jgi:hypothetical protein